MSKIIRTGDPFSADGTFFEIDLFEGVNISEARKDQAARDVGEYLVSEINMRLDSSNSIVSGISRFPGLTSKYKKKKMAEGGSSSPDLELSGAMRDAISYRTTASGVEVGVYKRKQALKADGHNNFSGLSLLPTRRFLPDKNQSLKSGVQRAVDEIVAVNKVGEAKINLSKLDDVSTKKQFQDFLTQEFGDLSRAAIRKAVISSPFLLDRFESLGFLNWI